MNRSTRMMFARSRGEDGRYKGQHYAMAYDGAEDYARRGTRNEANEYRMRNTSMDYGAQNGDMENRMRNESMDYRRGGARNEAMDNRMRNESMDDRARNESTNNDRGRMRNESMNNQAYGMDRSRNMNGGDEWDYAPRSLYSGNSGSGHQYMGQSHMAMGQDDGEEFNEMTAEKWVKSMENEDGSKGGHWSREQAKQVAAQVGATNLDPQEFYAVLNAMYSDYCKVGKKYGVDRPEFYGELAKSWLMDKDAVKDKAAMYYKRIVKH